jgi:membrane-associated protein
MHSGLLDRLVSLPSGWTYLAVGLLVFAEDAAFIGVVLPGETAAILGGVSASTHHTGLVAMSAVVVVGAILGDTVGYWIGDRYGVRLLDIGPLARRRDRIDRARAFIARRAGPSVFLARFVAFLRTLVPFLAGVAHMQYRVFLAYNALGGLVWGVAVVVVGYLAGYSFRMVAGTFGGATALAVVVLLVVALLVVRVRRSRARRRNG